MADVKFNIAKGEVWKHTGGIDLVGDDIRLVIVGNGVNMNAVDIEDLDTVGAIVGWTEFAGPGYNAGGEALASKAITTDDTLNVGKYDAADVKYTSVSADPAGDSPGLLLIKFITNTASSKPIYFYDVADFNGAGGDIDIVWPAGGVLQLT